MEQAEWQRSPRHGRRFSGASLASEGVKSYASFRSSVASLDASSAIERSPSTPSTITPGREQRRSFFDGPFRTKPDDHAHIVEGISAVAYAFHHTNTVGRHPEADVVHTPAEKPEKRTSLRKLSEQADKAPFGCSPLGQVGRSFTQGRQYIKRMHLPKVRGLLGTRPKPPTIQEDEDSFGVPAAPQPEGTADVADFADRPEDPEARSLSYLEDPLLSKPSLRSQGTFLRQISASTDAFSDYPADTVAEGSDFTWLLVFPLPMTTTMEDQSQFEATLRHENLSNLDVLVDVLEDAFGSFMAEKAVRGALSCTLTYSDEEAAESWAELVDTRRLTRSFTRTFTDRLISKKQPWRRDSFSKEEVEQFTLTKARQCTIELTLAYFHTFRKSCEDYFKSQSEKELRRNQYPVNCRSTNHIQVFKFTSEDKESLFVCARMSVLVAELHAEIEQYPLQLSKEGVKELDVKLSDPNSSPAHVQFERKFRKLFQMHDDAYDVGVSSVMRQKDRIRILYDKLTESLNLNQLESVGLISHSFPLHHERSVDALGRSWGTLWLLLSLKQPLEEIRGYFGEEIAFYFLFLHELVRATLFLALPALLLYWWQKSGGKGYARPLLSLIILVWYRVFTKKWQRTEALYSNRWGGDVHSVSTIKKLLNRRFKGQKLPAPVDENLMQAQVSRRTEIIGRTCSFLLSSAFIAILFVIVALEHYVLFTNGVFNERGKEHGRSFWDRVVHMAVGAWFGMQIKVVDHIWDRFSNWITDLEYRYYEEDFDWSKRVKASVVKFVTSVFTVILAAFAQPALEIHFHTHQEDEIGSLGTRRTESQIEQQRNLLEHQLFSIFFTRYLVLYGAINDVLQPWIKLVMETQREVSYVEHQVEMGTYGNYELTNDYLDAILPVGFVTFFGMIYPPSVLLLLLVLMVRVRADAWKLLNVYRRPYPHVAKDIGVFNSMLGLFAYGMVLTNLGLVMVDFGGIAQLFNLKFDPMFLTIYGLPVRTIWFLDALIFLAMALAISLFWHLLEFILDDTSHYVRTEQLRQDLQRHILSYTGFESVNLRRVALMPERLSTRVDFSRVRTYKQAASQNHLYTRPSRLPSKIIDL